jgi:hypothetical protein
MGGVQQRRRHPVDSEAREGGARALSLLDVPSWMVIPAVKYGLGALLPCASRGFAHRHYE